MVFRLTVFTFFYQEHILGFGRKIVDKDKCRNALLQPNFERFLAKFYFWLGEVRLGFKSSIPNLVHMTTELSLFFGLSTSFFKQTKHLLMMICYIFNS